MTEISDRELLRTRLRFLDLLKSFFTDTPDAEKLSRWRGTFSSLAAEPITPALDDAVRSINALLGSTSLKDIQNEYYALFVDPYSSDQLNTRASYQIDGRNNGPSLVRFRQLLQDSRLSRAAEIMEDEDSMPVMLDFLVTLVEDEKNGASDGRPHQQTLVSDFLLPTAEALQRTIQDNQAAAFYGACITFLNGYLELEKDLLFGR